MGNTSGRLVFRAGGAFDAWGELVTILNTITKVAGSIHIVEFLCEKKLDEYYKYFFKIEL